MELGDVLAAVRRWWLLIVAFGAVSGVAAGGIAATQTPAYTASAQALVSVADPQDRPPYALASGAQYILDRMTSYAELGVTTPVLTPVVDDLALDETPLSLSGRVNSQSIAGKAMLEVSVTYNDPKAAAAITDQVIAQMSRAVDTLENGNIALAPVGTAATPERPANQKVALNAGVATVGGLLLGCVVAVVLQFLDDRRRRRRSAEAVPTVSSPTGISFP